MLVGMSGRVRGVRPSHFLLSTRECAFGFAGVFTIETKPASGPCVERGVNNVVSTVSTRIRRLSLVAALVVASASAAYAADPSGEWRFSVEGDEGRALSATVVLAYEDGKLEGFVENRAGRAPISEARFDGDRVSFTVVREFGKLWRKKKFVTRYAATLADDTLTGTIRGKGRDDKPFSVEFVARRGD
jgi:hypothetical protein